MDLVYILGTGSLSNNDEIRYSLRSIHKHMLDKGNVYVVGNRPDFLKDVTFIHGVDNFVDRWKNAYYKTLQACNIEELSDEFLFMNDDFFATQNFTGEEVPFFALKNSNGGACGKHSFAVHYPIRFNKDMFKKMPVSLEMKGHISPRTFYGNFYNAPPTFTEDCILRVFEREDDYEIVRKDKRFFSTDDLTFQNQIFRDWLQSIFPDPSPWENTKL